MERSPMFRAYALSLIAFTSACGGGSTNSATGQDAGASTPDGGTTGPGGSQSLADAGVASLGCQGTFGINGLVPTRTFNLKPVSDRNCLMSASEGFVLNMVFPEGSLQVAQPTFEEHNHQEPHDGTPFSLSDPPGPGQFIVFWTPAGTSKMYESRDSQNSYTEPTAPGTAAITYTGTSPGDPIRIDVDGPITPDMGDTCFNLDFHVATTWQ